MEMMIELKKVDKYYKSRFQRTFILKNVDLKLLEKHMIYIWKKIGKI